MTKQMYIKMHNYEFKSQNYDKVKNRKIVAKNLIWNDKKWNWDF